MRIKYKSIKLERQCTNLKEAKKLFGGNESLARSLLARVNAIYCAQALQDVIVMPSFRFHNLHGKREGSFAIDVKSRRDMWRIILRPLDEQGEVFVSCRIDEIASVVEIVEIMEVSAHYE